MSNETQDNHGTPTCAHFAGRGKQAVNQAYQSANVTGAAGTPETTFVWAIPLRQDFALAALALHDYMRARLTSRLRFAFDIMSTPSEAFRPKGLQAAFPQKPERIERGNVK